MDNINKKRFNLSCISLTGTIIIVGLYVASIILYGKQIFFIALIGFVFVLIFLYLWSALYVKKQYEKLKIELYNEYLLNKLNCNQIVKSKNDDKFYEHFFDKKNVSINSNFDIVYNNKTLNVKEIELIESKFSKNKVFGSFRLISFDYNSEKIAFLASNFNETNLFEEYYFNSFKNKFEDVLANNKRYKVLYNEKYDNALANKLIKHSLFNALIIENNKAYILYYDKTQLFDFKIQYQIDENIINHLYECNEHLIKQIKELNR